MFNRDESYEDDEDDERGEEKKTEIVRRESIRVSLF